VQLRMQGVPDRLQQVKIRTHVLAGQVLVGVEDDLEAVAVHAPAWVPLRNMGEPVGGFEAEAPPDMDVFVGI
jgi:hypothetical protein